MDPQGQWRVSPAYDLTFSSGPGGEHSTMIMAEGRNPTKVHLLQLAEVGHIKREKALDIIQQVSEAIKQLRMHCFLSCNILRPPRKKGNDSGPCPTRYKNKT